MTATLRKPTRRQREILTLISEKSLLVFWGGAYHNPFLGRIMSFSDGGFAVESVRCDLDNDDQKFDIEFRTFHSMKEKGLIERAPEEIEERLYHSIDANQCGGDGVSVKLDRPLIPYQGPGTHPSIYRITSHGEEFTG